MSERITSVSRYSDFCKYLLAMTGNLHGLCPEHCFTDYTCAVSSYKEVRSVSDPLAIVENVITI